MGNRENVLPRPLGVKGFFWICFTRIFLSGTTSPVPQHAEHHLPDPGAATSPEAAGALWGCGVSPLSLQHKGKHPQVAPGEV